MRICTLFILAAAVRLQAVLVLRYREDPPDEMQVADVASAEEMEKTVQVHQGEQDEAAEQTVPAEEDDMALQAINEAQVAADLANAQVAPANFAAKEAAEALARTEEQMIAQEEFSKPILSNIEETEIWAKISEKLASLAETTDPENERMQLKARKMVADRIGKAVLAEANAKFPKAPETWDEAEGGWNELRKAHQEIQKDARNLIGDIKQRVTKNEPSLEPTLSENVATVELATATQPAETPATPTQPEQKVQITEVPEQKVQITGVPEQKMQITEARKVATVREDTLVAKKWLEEYRESSVPTERSQAVSPAMYNTLTNMKIQSSANTANRAEKKLAEGQEKLAALGANLDSSQQFKREALEAEEKATGTAQVLMSEAGEKRSMADVLRERKNVAKQTLAKLKKEAKKLEKEILPGN